MKKQTIIYNAHLMTMDENLGTIPHAAILIQGDTIQKITSDIEELAGFTAATRIDAKGAIVMPGMVDTHRHNWLSLIRDISGNESLPQFLLNTFYEYGAIFTAEDIETAIEFGALNAINAGTTTIFDVVDCINTPDHATATISSLKKSGIRAIFGYGMQAYNFKPQGFANHEARLKNAAMISQQSFNTNADELVKMGMLLTDMGTIEFAKTATEITLACEHQMTYASHTGAATTSIMLRGLRELNDHGLLRAGHIFAHCNGLNEEEWALIAKTGGKVSTTPSSELLMGMGFLPVDACIRHQIPFAVGIDYTGVTRDDLFNQLQIALLSQRMWDSHRFHQKDTLPFGLPLKIEDVLRWGTINGADVLGMKETIGSLTPGKKADLIMIKQQAMIPSCHHESSVLFQTTADQVDSVMINGIFRKQDGQLVDVDLAAIKAKANAAFERLQTRAVDFKIKTPEEVGKMFKFAERNASHNFAQAYDNGFLATLLK